MTAPHTPPSRAGSEARLALARAGHPSLLRFANTCVVAHSGACSWRAASATDPESDG